jgi:hypothetical protein
MEDPDVLKYHVTTVPLLTSGQSDKNIICADVSTPGKMGDCPFFASSTKFIHSINLKVLKPIFLKMARL